ncbi:hypothetical protein ACFFV7_17940 [Nonomuraea spiralis]|uniref:Uncharacterized protein n=1 Tax=Nonomuraea spiralis TaxID=46182 RepID=A0ABV5IF63_9ACTN|nr:hypothetical protein [Nonomuraea spiralis]GGS70486.1 hypothetical protein GCM10010176_011480 [Nonomuraea spiralis]
MNSIRRIAAGALAAAAVLTPAAAAKADTPYAQASATVRDDGVVLHSENIDEVRRMFRGTYCVILGEKVDLIGDVAIHVTPTGRSVFPRTLSVQRQAPVCSGHIRSVAVFSQVANGLAADTGFYLTVS